MNRLLITTKQLTLLLILSTFPVSAQNKKAKAEKSTNSPATSSFTTRPLLLPDGTWGYDVLQDGKVVIHQPSVPGLPGNSGFKSQEAAEKVAKLVIDKMKRGEMPPTVTIRELQQLGAVGK